MIHMLSFQDNLILMLLVNKEMYGYQVMKGLADITSGIYEPKSGTIYPALKRLEKRGFIKSEMRDVEGNRLKYYSITEKGKKRLERLWTIVSRIEDFKSKIIR
ncbi:MAG: PadR family transcriptional regulator [Candidatus Methanofastidiosia archaeon]